MPRAETPIVHVVEDDRAVRDGLTVLLEAAGYRVRAFARAEDFLGGVGACALGCVIADLRLPSLSGIELLDHWRQLGNPLPFILLTAFGNVSTAVSTFRNGGFDFLEKPIPPVELLAVVRRAVDESARWRSVRECSKQAERTMAMLSPRERQIFDLLIAGKTNRAIAKHLGISERTVEDHRAQVMRKTAARSVVELVTLAHDATRADAVVRGQ